MLETSSAHLSSDVSITDAQLLKNGALSSSNGENEDSKTNELLDEVANLLRLMSKEVTALSLALAPPKVAFPAVKAQCEKLADLAGKLVYATNLIQERPHSSADRLHAQSGSSPSSSATPLLSKSWRNAALSVIESLADLAKHARDLRSAAGPLVADKAAHRVTLSLTGIVWQNIDNAVKNGPRTEFEAFSQFWALSLGIIDDALNEVKELVEAGPSQETNGKHDAAAEDDFADFDEFEDDQLSLQEHKVASSILHIMKLVRALMKRVPTILQDRLANTPDRTEGSLMAVLTMQEAFTATHDDLASALQPPQVPDDIRQQLNDYVKAVTAISTAVRSRSAQTHSAGDLSAAIEACSLSEDQSGNAAVASAFEDKHDRWLAAFDEQIKIANSKALSDCAIESDR